MEVRLAHLSIKDCLPEQAQQQVTCMAFFAARQPILDRDKKLFAYELLFRDSLDNVFPDGLDSNQATSKMIEGLQLNLGLTTLIQDKYAFINFSHDTLINQYPKLLPNDQIVVEILETARPCKSLLNAIIDLKHNGYLIALDDYEHDPTWLHFFPHIDIIKVDWKLSTIKQINLLRKILLKYPHIKLLAEKVENYQEFNQAMEMGFSYFQGYFFSKPEIMESRTLSLSEMNLANLMIELSKEHNNINAIADVIEQDVNLTFRLLRYSQSPIFKRRGDISTVKHALVVLGEEELRRFVSVLFTAQFADSKPMVLNNMSLARARFCELAAEAQKYTDLTKSAFLVGLLSLLDALLDASLPELLGMLPLSEDIKLALLEQKGVLGGYLTLLQAVEHADWQAVAQSEQQLGMSKSSAAALYQQALIWANQRQAYI